MPNSTCLDVEPPLLIVELPSSPLLSDMETNNRRDGVGVMAKIINLKVGEEEYDAEEVAFEIAEEGWNKYKLTDGGEVRTKITVAKIFRVVDDKGDPTLTGDGDPMMVVRHNTAIVTSN